ncbi:MAG: caspase family protein [Alphaproteobacteria bacterium]
MLLVIVFAGVSSPGWSNERLALVIGNSDYRVAPLPNPVNDAALMSATLRAVGFTVFEHTNLNRRDMKRAFSDFGQKLEDSGDRTVGLIFYAGHGVQIGGENYLIPVGTQIFDELDVEIEGIRASSLLGTLRDGDTAMNIVILDACRNNPFKVRSRNAARGLAKMDAPTGTLLAYSTAPGDVAEDGAGDNSTYTAALARAIQAPGAKVEEVFKKVRINVMDRTQGRQVPWESSSLIGDFVFIEEATQQAQQNTQLAYQTDGVDSSGQPLTLPSSVQPQTNTVIEIEYWKSISGSNNLSLYQSYLRTYPDGLFKDIAIARIEELSAASTSAPEPEPAAQSEPEPEPEPAVTEAEREKLAWDIVKNSDDIASLEFFLKAYPDGAYADRAKQLIAAKKAPEVASLDQSPLQSLSDGSWDIEIVTTRVQSRDQGCPFCFMGEKLRMNVQMENGHFEESAYTNKNAKVTVEGTMLPSGQIKLRVNAWGGDGMNEEFDRDFDPKNGLDSIFRRSHYRYKIDMTRAD